MILFRELEQPTMNMGNKLPDSPQHHTSTSATQRCWHQNSLSGSIMSPFGHMWVSLACRGACATLQAFQILRTLDFWFLNSTPRLLKMCMYDAMHCGETTVDSQRRPLKTNGVSHFKVTRLAVLNFWFCCLVTTITTRERWGAVGFKIKTKGAGIEWLCATQLSCTTNITTTDAERIMK